MNTLTTAAHRAATRTRTTRLVSGTAGVTLLLAAVVACSPAAGTPSAPQVPVGSGGILPSLNVSPLASAAAQGALAALDALQGAVTANASASGLSADDANTLSGAIGTLKTAIQTGDTTQIRAAVTDLSTKLDSVSSKLNGTTGAQLKVLIDAMKSAMPSPS
jgi:hypothetical protein